MKYYRLYLYQRIIDVIKSGQAKETHFKFYQMDKNNLFKQRLWKKR